LRKLGMPCDAIVVDRDALIDMVKYQSPRICIDFDEEQEKLIKEFFPEKECDFAIFHRARVPKIIILYMPPGPVPIR